MESVNWAKLPLLCLRIVSLAPAGHCCCLHSRRIIRTACILCSRSCSYNLWIEFNVRTESIRHWNIHHNVTGTVQEFRAFFFKKFGWYCFPFAAVLMMCNVVRPISIFFLRKIYTGNSMIAVDVSVGISMCEVGLKVSYVCLVAER